MLECLVEGRTEFQKEDKTIHSILFDVVELIDAELDADSSSANKANFKQFCNLCSAVSQFASLLTLSWLGSPALLWAGGDWCASNSFPFTFTSLVH